MSSIRVHQDLFNFERRRKGFTNRQWAGTVAGGACFAAAYALVAYLFEPQPSIAVSIALIAALPGIAVGWVPFAGMPADEAFRRWADIDERGPVVVWAGETVPNMEDAPEHARAAGSREARSYRRASAKRGAECSKETVEMAKEEREREREDRKRNKRNRG